MEYTEIEVTPEELRKAYKNNDMVQVFWSANAFWGRCLKREEIKALIWLMKERQFDTELMEYLLEYCIVEKKVKDVEELFRIGEKWAKKEIDTVDKAKKKYKITGMDNKSHSEKPSKKKEEKYRICPVCGNVMLKRTARNGIYAGNQFWGCSTFPKCRYIEQLDD